MNDKEYLDKIFKRLKNTYMYKYLKKHGDTIAEVIEKMHNDRLIEESIMYVLSHDYPDVYEQYVKIDAMPDSEEKHMKEEELDKKYFNPYMYDGLDSLIQEDFHQAWWETPAEKEKRKSEDVA